MHWTTPGRLTFHTEAGELEQIPTSWLLGAGEGAGDITGAGVHVRRRANKAKGAGARDGAARLARDLARWRAGVVTGPQADSAVLADVYLPSDGWHVADLDLARARAWSASRAALARSVAERLQRIGRRAARRAAIRQDGKRGLLPSDTSLDDCAADAVASALKHLPWLADSNPARARARLTEGRYLRAVYLFAGRGASNSSRRFDGFTGADKGKRQLNIVTTEGNPAVAMLATGEQSTDVEPWLAETAAKRQFVRAVFAASVAPFRGKAGAGAASGRRAALARARVVGCVVLRDMALQAACELCGFGRVDEWQRAIARAQLWQTMRAARASSPLVAKLRADARAVAQRASDTRRSMAAHWRTLGAGAGGTVGNVPVTRRVATARAGWRPAFGVERGPCVWRTIKTLANGGGVLVKRVESLTCAPVASAGESMLGLSQWQAVSSVQVGTRRAVITGPLSAQWTRMVSEYASAVSAWRNLRARARSAAQANLAAWDKFLARFKRSGVTVSPVVATHTLKRTVERDAFACGVPGSLVEMDARAVSVHQYAQAALAQVGFETRAHACLSHGPEQCGCLVCAVARSRALGYTVEGTH